MKHVRECWVEARVFCVQTSALIPIGDIFLYGNTAALAWNLPTEAKDLLMFKEDKNTARRRRDEETYFTNVSGKRSAIVNPALAKRSVDENMTFKEKLKIKIDRAKMHERKLKRDFLNKQHLDHDSVEFHRSTRVGLYEKLIPLITALGGDGRQCVLYKLCESARFSRQGTFLEEFLRVVFTLPKGREFQDNAYREYDSAHTETDDCTTLYPGCDFYLPMQKLNKYKK
ncbi:unnamed protein product, partial [Brenthis ino]